MPKLQTNLYLDTEDREFLYKNPEKKPAQIVSELIAKERFGGFESSQDSEILPMENVRID